MNKYQHNNIPQTFSFYTTLIISMMTVSSIPSNSDLTLEQCHTKDNWVTDKISPSYNPVHNFEISSYTRKNEFEETIINFYGELASSQEELGDEFEQVLADSLWDLYQS